MDNLIWVIYLIDVLTQPMKGLAIMLVVLFIVGLVLHVVYSLCDTSEAAHRSDIDFIRMYKSLPVKTVTIVSFVILLLSNFIPSKDTAYKMLAVYGVSEVAKSDNVKELMGDGMDILKLTLKDYKEKLEGKLDKPKSN